MTEAEVRELRSAKEFASMVRLERVRFYDISGQWIEEPEGTVDVTEPSIQVLHRTEAESMDVRAIFEAKRVDLHLTIDLVATFKWDEEIHLRKDTINRFLRDTGIPWIYPYVRQTVSDMISRLQVEPIDMPFRPTIST